MSETIAESGTRARTRRAILDAAVTVLTREPGASMATIAGQAGVGRTTMHRYFPERSDLIAALSADTMEKVNAAHARARLQDGPILDALDRLCQEYFELGDIFMLSYTEPQLLSGPEWKQPSPQDREFLDLIDRGRTEGVIDSRLDPAWVQQVLWSMLFSGWEHIKEGAARHDALSLCLLTFRKAISR
ncbi:TetR/AcrR family transcriptional regulator [Nocardia crassostreae]|uniref:TetR/AcrR family transcriptional regulator n=1 Tax=Nocardia crassostreae TaxID=53428 RepID=UPI000830DD4F|nr:TetR/AcrR family transcriptional regulator [Nocardia crassostreae]